MTSLEQHSGETIAAPNLTLPLQKSSYKWWALSCTSLGTLMATLNSGTLIIALPNLLRALHTDLITLIWVLLAYMLVQTVLVLTAGHLADTIGRKRLYVLGFAIFGIAALIAGFSTEGWQLIIARALQGAAGAFMIANSSAIVTDAFPSKQLGLALGTNMIVASVGSILGTILGGWLVTIGWQWIFWFNVPISLIGTFWALSILRELSRPSARPSYDLLGTGAYIIAVMGLLLALTFGGIQGWTDQIVIGGFIAAIIFFPIFLVLESRTGTPMMDLKLFQHRGFTLGNLSVLFNAMARMGVTFLFVFFFQGPKGYDPLTAGLLLTPIAASMLVISPLSGILADRYGSHHLSLIGLILSTIGLAGMAFIDLHSPYWYIILTMCVMGIGGGFFNSPNTRLIMTSVSSHQRGIAAGTRSMLMNTGGVFSIAMTLAIITTSVPAKVLFSIFAGVATGLPGNSLGDFVNGLHIAFWMMTALSFISVIIAAIPKAENEIE